MRVSRGTHAVVRNELGYWCKDFCVFYVGGGAEAGAVGRVHVVALVALL